MSGQLRSLVLYSAFMTATLARPAQAQGLSQVGPTSPDHGFPEWYMDSQGLQLELCLSDVGLCGLDAPVTLTDGTLAFPDNFGGSFPDEAFWSRVVARMPTNNGGQAILVLALEAAFANGPTAAGDQISFGRIRVRLDNLIAGQTYDVTTPYGVFSFVAANAGPRGVNFTGQVGGAAGDFNTALAAPLGPFLMWDSGLPIVDAAGNQYIGDFGVDHTITGSPSGTNFFRVDGPSVGGPGINSIQTDLFAVIGKVGGNAVGEVPPVPDIGATPTSGPAPLSVAFTDNSVGVVRSRTWDFGDGTTATVQNPTHVFANVGPYNVTLSVSNVGGADAGSVSITATEPAPVASFIAAPTSGVPALSVAFTDQSTLHITSWAWDFGDGTMSSLQNPLHSYQNVGTYTVTLMVTSAGGTNSLARTNLITVNEPPPVAAFDAVPTTGFPALAVAFTDRSTLHVTNWAWDFGDGTFSLLQNPTHVYQNVGSYTVTLMVTSAGGTNTLTRPNLITVSEPVPVAAFDATPTSGLPGLSVAFMDRSTLHITNWAWDFGDGASSSLQNPTHVYQNVGSYAVTLTVTSAGGTNTLTRPNLITVNEPPPMADFVGDPRSGFAPLEVSFMDLSSGSVTSLLWDFGDGQNSSLADPMHVYQDPGDYTVKLRATGPGGIDVAQKDAYVHVSAQPALSDGSFEQQIPGTVPASPWTVAVGTNILVDPSGLASDNSLPTHGANWCEIGAEGSSAALPPSNPLGAGSLPQRAATLRQVFTFDPSAPHLAFNAAFLLGEPPASAAHNDFMSVDVSDGSSHHNVFYADTFSSFPLTSDQYLVPMTKVQTLHADLAALFPGATNTTVLTLYASVGNAGDGRHPSRGYVDRFEFVPAATAVVRNGSGLNRLCYQAGAPVLGTNWIAQVDSSQHPGAMLNYVLAYDRAITLPALGQELLIDVTSQFIFALPFPSTGGVDQGSVRVPLNLDLVGLFAASQAVIIGGGGAELCNAVDMVTGF